MSKKNRVRRVGIPVRWDLNLKKTLGGERFMKILAGVVVKDIKSGLTTGRDINGRSFKKLKSSTVRQKKKRGQTGKPLIATGMMKKLPPVTAKQGKAIISVAKQRDDIAVYHSTGSGDLPKRDWFGVSKKAERKLDRAVKQKARGFMKQGHSYR